MLSKTQHITFVNQFFSSLGLSTTSVDKHENFKSSKQFIIYNLILCAFMIAFCICGIQSTYFSMFQTKPLELSQVVDICLILASIAVAALIHCHYCIRTNECVQILQSLKDNFCKLSNMGYKFPKIPRFFLIAFLVNFSISITYFISSFFVWHTWLSVLMNFLPNCIIIWLVLQYVLVVKLLFIMFKSVNNFLESLKMIESHNFHFHLEIYYDLCDLTKKISNFYGFPILVSLTFLLSSLIGNSYFLSINLIKRPIIFRSSTNLYIPYVPILLMIIWHVFCFLTLSRGTTGILNEVIY